MGHTVILQDDAFFHLLEEPADGAADAKSAALVGFGIEPFNMTGPVNFLLDHRSGGGHFVGLTRPIWIRAITGHEHPRGCDWADGVNHLAQRVGAAPGDQKEWGHHSATVASLIMGAKHDHDNSSMDRCVDDPVKSCCSKESVDLLSTGTTKERQS